MLEIKLYCTVAAAPVRRGLQFQGRGLGCSAAHHTAGRLSGLVGGYEITRPIGTTSSSSPSGPSLAISPMLVVDQVGVAIRIPARFGYEGGISLRRRGAAHLTLCKCQQIPVRERNKVYEFDEIF